MLQSRARQISQVPTACVIVRIHSQKKHSFLCLNPLYHAMNMIAGEF
jgi:hypothetical protein